MSTYPRDRWATAVPAIGGTLLPPGLRNRRRYAFYQASLLADHPWPDPVDAWEAKAVNDLLAMTGRRPAAGDLTRGFEGVVATAATILGGLWVFKGIHAVVGVHGPAWSLMAAPAEPQRVIVCFDALAGVAVEYGGTRESDVERVLLADGIEQLAAAVAIALAAAEANLAVFPPRAHKRAEFLAAEITGEPYPYVLPDAARSARRPGISGR